LSLLPVCEPTGGRADRACEVALPDAGAVITGSGSDRPGENFHWASFL